MCVMESGSRPGSTAARQFDRRLVRYRSERLARFSVARVTMLWISYPSFVAQFVTLYMYMLIVQVPSSVNMWSLREAEKSWKCI